MHARPGLLALAADTDGQFTATGRFVTLPVMKLFGLKHF
jgi:hypothetical protein